jgi:HEAT repeat protein
MKPKNKIIVFLLFSITFLIYAEVNKKESKKLPNEKVINNEEYQSLVKKIKYLNTTERIYTIKSLEKLSKEDQKKFYDLLAEISLKDADPLVREKALSFLADNKADCDDCIKAYKENLFYNEEKVQLQALKGIENLELKNLIQEMQELIQKTDFKQNGIFVNALIRTLGKLQYNQKEITNLLLEKYKSNDTHIEVKRSILLYIGSSNSQDLKEILLEVIEREEDLYLKAYAINSIGKLAKNYPEKEKREMIEKLKKIYNDILSISNTKERAKYNPLKQHLILSLIRLGDDSIKDEIKKMAMDDDANVRLKALDYIEDLELKDFKELIEVKYKYDPSKSVKNKAKEILEKWGELKKE